MASTITPFGMIAAGQFGIGVLSIGAGLPGGPEALADQWKIDEDTATKHGKTMDRKAWRVVVNAHVAEDDEQALREVKLGERCETVTYFEDTLGRPPVRADDPLRDGVKMGTTLVGSPETVANGIRRLLEYSQGGFGGILFRAHEWANREQTLRSYELFARYVIPQFQGSLDTVVGSNQFVRDNRQRVVGGTVEAVRRAFTDHGRAVPEGFRERTIGARDVQQDPKGVRHAPRRAARRVVHPANAASPAAPRRSRRSSMSRSTPNGLAAARNARLSLAARTLQGLIFVASPYQANSTQAASTAAVTASTG